MVGDSEDSATTTLKNAGFEVSVQYSESSDSVGKVISTSPKNGNSATKGSTVTITVGKAPSKVSVPSVIGMTYSDAADKLKANGFYAGLASGSSSSGIVTDQSETTATKGDTIYLTTKVESSGNDGSGSLTAAEPPVAATAARAAARSSRGRDKDSDRRAFHQEAPRLTLGATSCALPIS